MLFIAKGKTDSSGGIPEGDHDVTITEASNIRSSKKGTPGIKMKFRSSSGKIATGTLWLTEAGIGFMESAMASIGKPVKIDESFQPQSEDFLGASARIRVKLNDNGFSELENWLPPSKAKLTALEEELSDDEIPF
jgi:hypothetical protein